MQQMNDAGGCQRLLSVNAVAAQTSLSRYSIRRLAKAGQFPAPLQITPRRVAWLERDILDWMKTRRPVQWAA